MHHRATKSWRGDLPTDPTCIGYRFHLLGVHQLSCLFHAIFSLRSPCGAWSQTFVCCCWTKKSLFVPFLGLRHANLNQFSLNKLELWTHQFSQFFGLQDMPLMSPVAQSVAGRRRPVAVFPPFGPRRAKCRSFLFSQDKFSGR